MTIGEVLASNFCIAFNKGSNSLVRLIFVVVSFVPGREDESPLPRHVIHDVFPEGIWILPKL